MPSQLSTRKTCPTYAALRVGMAPSDFFNGLLASMAPGDSSTAAQAWAIALKINLLLPCRPLTSIDRVSSVPYLPTEVARGEADHLLETPRKMECVVEAEVGCNLVYWIVCSQQLAAGAPDDLLAAILARCRAGQLEKAFAEKGVGHVHRLGDLGQARSGQRPLGQSAAGSLAPCRHFLAVLRCIFCPQCFGQNGLKVAQTNQGAIRGGGWGGLDNVAEPLGPILQRLRHENPGLLARETLRLPRVEQRAGKP